MFGGPRILATALVWVIPVQDLHRMSFPRIFNIATMVLTSRWFLHVCNSNVLKNFSKFSFLRRVSYPVNVSIQDRERDWLIHTVNYMYGFCSHLKEHIFFGIILIEEDKSKERRNQSAS